MADPAALHGRGGPPHPKSSLEEMTCRPSWKSTDSVVFLCQSLRMSSAMGFAMLMSLCRKAAYWPSASEFSATNSCGL